jgi:integrase
MSSVRLPKYRLHKGSGQAVVTLSGRDFYLGPYHSSTSRTEYDRLTAEWLAHGRRTPGHRGYAGDLSVNELLAAYWQYAQSYYVKGGEPTSELSYIRVALHYLRGLYGQTPVAELGPLALKAVRQCMIDSDVSRGVINGCVGRIKRVFKWGVANELMPPDVHHGLAAVDGLREGRSEARETEPIRPVPDAHVDAVKPPVSRQVWAIIELQRLTGMRPGEVILMRACDLDMSGSLWTYTPTTHKTIHHGHARIIDLGPKAQQSIRPFLTHDLLAFLFSPAEAEAERSAAKHALRRTTMTPSALRRWELARRRRRRRPPGDRYTTASYRRAIQRACRGAGVPEWHPHQLRHTFATRVRRDFGLEAARLMLGHSSMVVTQVYAEQDRQAASQIAAKVG